MSWLLAFVGFALLVILHELGHFTAAKTVGMRVERFSLFFPPLLARKKVGETEYAIGAIPLGGYVKISGMNPDEDLPDEVRTRAYYSQPVWKRIVVIAAGPAVNLLLAFVLLFVFFTVIGPETTTRDVARGGDGLPGGRRRSSPATGSWRWTAARRHAPKLSERIASHTCPRRIRPKGCKADHAGDRLTVVRDGERETLELTPIYDPTRPPRTRLGFAYAPGPARPALRSARRVDQTRRRVLVHHARRRSSSRRGCSTPRTARRSPAWWAPTRSRARRS